MSKIVDDLFKTNGKWDITNPAFSFIPWLISIFAYLAAGLITLHKNQDADTLMKLALGLGALFSTGLAGVFFHSKSST